MKQSDESIELRRLADEIEGQVWDDDREVTEVSKGAPAPTRAVVPLVLAFPRSHRAGLVVGIAALAVAGILALVALGVVPSWIR